MVPTEEDVLRLMRRWLAEDADSRVWMVRLHHRGKDYARAQLWQVRKELAEGLRYELRALEAQDRPKWARFETETLLRAVLHAAERLALRSGEHAAGSGAGAGGSNDDTTAGASSVAPNP